MKTTEFIGAAERQLYELTSRMVAYNAGDPKRIQHLIKVHYFARMIGLAEHVDEATQLILEAAAIVHDIGIRTHCRIKPVLSSVKNISITTSMPFLCNSLTTF